MVNGIDTFKRYFADYEDSYIIIGGTACDIIEESYGQNPRATKDIDIILIVEVLKPEFVKKFWQFIVDGDYSTRQRGNGKNEYYRFLKPKAKGFPIQLELFARKPDVLNIAEASTLTPIPINEDLSSLSAILMNEAYYNYTLEHSIIIDGIRIANIESLICLKAKAFIDLSQRKQNGEQIDSTNIRKHPNDIFRLAVTLTGTASYPLPDELHDDFTEFCRMVSKSLPDKTLFKSAGLNNIDSQVVFNRLCQSFQVNL